MDKFLIFGLGRSGTTSLICALNVDDNVVHEPFSSQSGDIGVNKAFTRILEANGYMPQDLPESTRDYYSNRFNFIALDSDLCHRFLEQLYATFTGVKHIWNTVSEAANINILRWCLANDIKLIFQTRESLGRSVVSRHLAEQSRVWQLGHELEHKERLEGFKYGRIDVKHLRAEIRSLRQQLHFYIDFLNGKPHHSVTFEALFLQVREHQEDIMQSLCAFLSGRITDLYPANLENYIYQKARRQTSDEMLRSVPNFREFRKYL